MTPSLSGQVALITGAGRGIGRAIAEHLAAAGMRCALVSRTGAELETVAAGIADRGGEAAPLIADVLDFAAMANAVTAAVDRFGRLDLLVNNAGLLSSVGPLWETDPAEWERDLRVNVTGVYHGCRHAIPAMIAGGGGRVVNLVGGGALAPFVHASAYATSKAAVMRLTENLARELDAAAAPVKVFAMTPGLVRTSMTEPMADTEAGRRWLGVTAGYLDRGEDVPPELAARLVAAVAGGGLDGFHGRFLSAPGDTGDLDALRAEGKTLGPDDRVLRVPRREG